MGIVKMGKWGVGKEKGELVGYVKGKWNWNFYMPHRDEQTASERGLKERAAVLCFPGLFFFPYTCTQPWE